MNPYSAGFAEGLLPDPDQTVTEWADEFRILPSKGAAEPGRYRSSRVPFAREIMECLSPTSPIERVIFMKSSQVGGTEIGLNWLGAIIHRYPAPVMIVQPTIELAERFSKQRVEPMLEETPELREIIPPARTRDSGNSILMKNFRGGVVVISGSNSAVSLRSMPVRFLFCDEVSAYEKDVGDEGDPVSLAEKRTQTFSRRKIFLNSTPTTKDTCRIESEYLGSDQRRFYVPCPHCQHMQYLQFKNLKWTDGDPNTAEYQCESCGALIEEYHKTKMLAAGEWRATAHCENSKVRGYHINALYSPLGWKSWASIVDEFLKSKHDPALLKAFVNSILGETFEEEYASKIGADGLKEKAEFYEPNVAPARALVLTAGVDVQDNRFAVSIYGWGRGEEAWVVFHQEIHGDPARPEIWKQLDNILSSTYRHELGGELKIYATAIDTGGHFTHEVYQFCRERRTKGVIPVKGQSQKNKPAIGKPTKQDINFRGQVMKSGVELYPMGSDTIKSTLFGRLKHNEPGEGFIHFRADLPDEFFNQITSEKQILRYVKGFPIREWVKKNSARNEALDCMVMSYAALQHLYTKFNRATIWEQLERRLNIKRDPSVDPKSAPAPDVASNDTESHQKSDQIFAEKLQNQRPNRNVNLNRRRTGFVNRW